MKYLTLAEAAKHFPLRRGKKVHIDTLIRRIKRGCRGVKLRAILDGGQWFTTEEWIREFQEECTRRSLPEERQQELQDEEAERAMERLRRRLGFGEPADGSVLSAGTRAARRRRRPPGEGPR